MDDELKHYGVVDMKWGVRRDARILANSRRNKKVREAIAAYETGKITSEQKRSAIKSANSEKKSSFKQMKRDYRDAKTKDEATEITRKIRNDLQNEVGHVGVKRGAHIVKNVVTGVNTASTVSVGASAVAAMMVNPAFGVLYAGTAAYAAALTAGQYFVMKTVIDKNM